MLQTALPQSQPTADLVDAGLRILVLDDSDLDLRRVSRMISEIRSDVFVKTTKTLQQFETAFHANMYDLCLIDHSLGGGKTSSDAMKVIKSSTIASHTPAVLVTGLSDDSVIIEAVKHGFVNYIEKSSMTVGALKTVISEALDEAALAKNTHVDRLNMVNQVMDDVALLYSSHTKEHLSKIYKSANFLRQCIAHNQFPSPEAIDDIEACCFAVWRFLDDAENHGPNFRRRLN